MPATSVPQMLQQALACQTSGRLAEAEALYRHVLQAEPNNADALHMLGMLAYQVRRFDVAAELIQRAAAIAPDRASIRSNLGLVYLEQRQLDKAEQALRQALVLNANFAPAQANLGMVLYERGKLEEAAAAFRAAIAAAPQHPHAHHNLGMVLYQQGQYEAALAEEELALRLNPNYPEAINGRAMALRQLDRTEEAIASLRRAIAIKRDFVEAYNNLAGVLQSIGQVDEAVELFRQSLRIRPSSAVHSNLLYAMLFQWGDEPQAMFQEHVAWARLYAGGSGFGVQGSEKNAGIFLNPEPRTLNPLRIGYVSAHFCRHAVAVFMEPVIASHDHSAVRVFCYSDVRCPDEVTARFRSHADVWRDVAGLTDDQLAQLIRQDGIDILVDLAGHIAGNRMLLFARKRAPIQVSYLGYQATTGLATMDYRLTDSVADPPGQTESFHTEKLFRLPKAFFCYRPPIEMPPVNELPARTAGHITFASMNNFAKVTPRCLSLWARILQAVPNSRLLLLIAGGPQNAPRILPIFAKHGIDPSRIELVGRQGLHQYMALYQQIDILLDPLPFSGHTTTCDALWMGVPVVTLAGPAYVSRMTASVLTHLPMPAFIAQTPDQYLAIATSLARNLDHLADLRRQLRPMIESSYIANPMAFTRDLEAAYRQMYLAR